MRKLKLECVDAHQLSKIAVDPEEPLRLRCLMLLQPSGPPFEQEQGTGWGGWRLRASAQYTLRVLWTVPLPPGSVAKVSSTLNILMFGCQHLVTYHARHGAHSCCCFVSCTEMYVSNINTAHVATPTITMINLYAPKIATGKTKESTRKLVHPTD